MNDVRQVRTDDLTIGEVAALRQILRAAFAHDDDGGFTEDDWQHALGGLHFIADFEGQIAAHAAVVEREIHLGNQPFRTGYVEGVATAPSLQGRGFGSLVMTPATEYIRGEFELGALGTGAHHFYERLGWRTWRGRSFVRTPGGPIATSEDDGYILVLETPRTGDIDLESAISCDWRPGDAW